MFWTRCIEQWNCMATSNVSNRQETTLCLGLLFPHHLIPLVPENEKLLAMSRVIMTAGRGCTVLMDGGFILRRREMVVTYWAIQSILHRDTSCLSQVYSAWFVLFLKNVWTNRIDSVIQLLFRDVPIVVQFQERKLIIHLFHIVPIMNLTIQLFSKFPFRKPSHTIHLVLSWTRWYERHSVSSLGRIKKSSWNQTYITRSDRMGPHAIPESE